MSSWEEIANEVVPDGASPARGLVTGAARSAIPRSGRLGAALEVARYLACPQTPPNAHVDLVWGGRGHHWEEQPYYHIDRHVLEFDAQAQRLAERLHAALANPPSRWLAGLCAADLLFCDIETTGLSSSNPLFLIGTMRFVEEEPRIHLYLARTFEEEAAVLGAFAQHVEGRTLVTFNGKSFDWPYIRSRATRLEVDLAEPAGHYDLLYTARARWRSRLPNCKLQTLEMGICGRGREGDIPSSQIPSRYHDFVRSSASGRNCAHLLAPVLFHNALDVLTMAELICCMGEEGPLSK